MRWSFSIGTVAGTAVRVHFTFLLFLMWIAASAYLEGGFLFMATAVSFMAALFVCVVLHEFGHILMARKFGIKTPEIVLLPIGGVSRLERIPERPAEELLMALAGPVVSLAIGAGLLLTLGGPPSPVEIFSELSLRGLLGQLAYANIVLALFNLLPAFPMDGGRILRALLAARLGHGRGTRLAATIGRGAAIALGLIALSGGHLMLMVIAFFIFAAAGVEANLAQIRTLTLGIPAGEVMITDFETLAADAPITDAAEALMRTVQRDFPVVDRSGVLVGVLTREDLLRAYGAGEGAATIGDAMTREVPRISQWDHLDGVLDRLQDGAPLVAVAGPGGCLVGIITWENLLEDMLLAQARSGRGWPLTRIGTGTA